MEDKIEKQIQFYKLIEINKITIKIIKTVS